MDCKKFDRVLLMAEAILIILDLVLYGNALAGMICYWSIVVLYHLTDIVQGRKNDGKA